MFLNSYNTNFTLALHLKVCMFIMKFGNKLKYYCDNLKLLLLRITKNYLFIMVRYKKKNTLYLIIVFNNSLLSI